MGVTVTSWSRNQGALAVPLTAIYTVGQDHVRFHPPRQRRTAAPAEGQVGAVKIRTRKFSKGSPLGWM